MSDTSLGADLGTEIEQLERDLDGTGSVMSAFSKELSGLRAETTRASRELAALKSGISGGLKRAIDDVVIDGAKLSDIFGDVIRSVVDTAYSAAVKPVTDQGGSLLAAGIQSLMNGMSPFANGGTFSVGRVQPFARGGVVSGPTMFPMRGGTGLMGEAGPEAIMPLVRNGDGRLGVQAQGDAGRPVNVTFNISTPDVAGFERSKAQIAAQMQRAIGLGQRTR